MIYSFNDQPAGHWLTSGDVGTVVHIYKSSDLYEMEFINANGDTVGIGTLNADQIKAVDLDRVILHYNDLENAA